MPQPEQSRIERATRRVYRSLGVVLGLMHPEIASGFQPGWTAALPKIEATPFKAKPRKARRAA